MKFKVGDTVLVHQNICNINPLMKRVMTIKSYNPGFDKHGYYDCLNSVYDPTCGYIGEYLTKIVGPTKLLKILLEIE